MSGGAFVTADGCRLAFFVEGEGRPVLWQHGLGAGEEQPASVFPHRPGLQRITLMCRGLGESDLGDPAFLSIATLTADALALLDHVEVERGAVGGISLGVGIALRLAVLHSVRVTRLVLARPAWVDQPGPQTQMAYVAAGDFLARHGEGEGLRLFQASDAFARLKAASEDNAASLIGFFSRPRPETTVALLARRPKDGPGVSRRASADIAVPTLVIGHDADLVHPLAYAEDLAGLIAGARLARITAKALDRACYTREFTEALAFFLDEGRS